MDNPLFVLGPDIKAIFQQGIDTIIDQLGTICTVVSPGPLLPCSNCLFDPTKGASSGKWKPTGVRPFTSGPCPVCRGSGHEQNEVRTDVKVSVRRNVKLYAPVADGKVVKAATVIRVKGLVADAAPFRTMEYALIAPDDGTGLVERYTAYSAPEKTGSIVQGRYFIMYLQKA